MALLTISEAARVAGVSRVTLHRYIKAGKLSRNSDGTIDTAELLRAGFVLHHATPVYAPPVSPLIPPATSAETPPVTAPDPATLQQLITLLQRELEAAHAREEAARERETQLLQMLAQMQHQNQRLLDMPRTLPVLSPQRAPGPAQPLPPSAHRSGHPDAPPGQPGAVLEDARGAMRRRIIALLQNYPEGLTPAQMRTLLGAERRLAATCLGMRRDGWLRRVGHGVYVVATPPPTE